MSERPSRSWIHDAASTPARTLDAAINDHYLIGERRAVEFLLEKARPAASVSEAVNRTARELVTAIRHAPARGGIDALLAEYDLSSAEGVALMCLAEALLRIPDADTADRLIAEKLHGADWETHLGHSESWLVNASTWALMLTGRWLAPQESPDERPGAFLARLVGRAGEPFVRGAVRHAMRVLGQQFVMGESIGAAIERSRRDPAYLYSFDMLGEAAMTETDAARYFEAYSNAIETVGHDSETAGSPTEAPSISIKLSALYPRYETAQRRRALAALTERLGRLVATAATAGIGVTVDAEEAERLELGLEVFEAVFRSSAAAHFAGFGIAVQAYQKRAWHVLRWLEDLGHSERRVIPVRLVKGAYWDTEIKRAQELGLEDYPVFTLKSNTDLSYLACAKLLLQESPHLYPQFATHNAQAVAWVLEHGSHRLFEFQRLHGMGEELYGELAKSQRLARPCRVYAPVGSHRDLLPYLVRRLLENGANTSFVNRLLDAEAPLEAIVADPIASTMVLGGSVSHPKIRLPKFMFAPERKNSSGLNLADSAVRNALAHALANSGEGHWQTRPIVDGRQVGEEEHPQLDPADQRRRVGTVAFASASTALAALDSAAAFQPRWEQTPASARADCLRRAAGLFETHAAELIARCVAEAGRTVPDSHAELREAVDFLRYYATQAERLYGAVTHLPGPTGEANRLRLRGRGVFLALSPWNFPLSIFTGQVAAALAAGNTVLAKPAEQSCLVAGRAVELLLEAGIPPRALHWLPGAGPYLGAALLPDPRIAGVVFTGSHATALHINRTLAARRGALATLIAETGGINAMLVDNSALPEQVVRDAAYSAFNSAGQRCSALRLLCLPEQTADRILEMLLGFVDTLVVGDPALFETDVGPVIDAPSKASLEEHVAANRGRVLYQSTLDASHDHGIFFPPTVIEVELPAALTREVFGPVLHVLRYRERKLDELVDAVNTLGFGLTLGIHSRIESVAARIAARARVGNVYVNRNMIGAQVGVQPFGGMGLSGTGPKAGGPHYVERFGVEQSLATNTAAVGGNATLLSLGTSRTQ